MAKYVDMDMEMGTDSNRGIDIEDIQGIWGMSGMSDIVDIAPCPLADL